MDKQHTYDPHNPESVAAFWEGATITHKHKVLGKASRKPPVKQDDKEQP